MHAAAALLLALQALGPWTQDGTQNIVRRAHQGPFDGRTTVWLRLAPRAPDPRVSPTTFVFVADFAGKQPRARPPVTLHVESDVRVYPLLARVPRFSLTIDEAPPIDLLAPGEQTSLAYCCGDSPIPTGATVPLSASRLDRLAAAGSVSGDALGVRFTLDRSQLRAVAEFLHALLPESY
jgi:hypothetical protein